MTAEFDDHALQNGIDTAFEYGGLLLRALGYAALYAVASNYDCGRPMLAGVLAGDLVSHVVLVFLRWHDSLLTIASELALTALVVLLVRDQLAWPAEPTGTVAVV